MSDHVDTTQTVKSDDERFIEAVKHLDLKDPVLKTLVTPGDLIEILKEDVVYAFERPGSWEGSNMLTVLHSHGFISY